MQAIHEHRLAPGTKLGEDDLSDIYGVSRTIVRTALLSLAHQQIIEIKRNRGAFVAQHATPEDTALLSDHITQEHAAMDAGDRGRALFLSGQFHVEIAPCVDQSNWRQQWGARGRVNAKPSR